MCILICFPTKFLTTKYGPKVTKTSFYLDDSFASMENFMIQVLIQINTAALTNISSVAFANWTFACQTVTLLKYISILQLIKHFSYSVQLRKGGH